MRRPPRALVTLPLLLVLLSCSWIRGEGAPSTGSAPIDPAGTITFATGRQGGSQYPISVALGQVLETRTSLKKVTLTPGGGAANVAGVDQGRSQLGITLSMSAVDGFEGKPPYKQPAAKVAHLFALHPFNLVTLVGKNSGIDSFQELRGKRVNVGPAGFTSVQVADLLFGKVYGFPDGAVRTENLEITDAVEQFKNGQLDALLYTPSDRFAAYIDLAQTRDVKVLPIDQEHRQRLMGLHPSFYETSFPTGAGIYKGLDEPVPSVGFANTIVVNSDQVSEQLGYDMVKAVAENFAAIQAVEPSLAVLEPKDLAAPVEGMPLHPGAERYFREKGWLG